MLHPLKITAVIVLASSLYACDSNDDDKSGEIDANSQALDMDDATQSDSEVVGEPDTDDDTVDQGGAETPMDGADPISPTDPSSPTAPDPGDDTDSTTPVAPPVEPVEPDDQTGVMFLNDNWSVTARAANSALNLPQLTAIRDAVSVVFPPAEQVSGTTNLSCDSGDARITVEDPFTMYEFNECEVDGVTLVGSYQTDESTNKTGADTKTKFDDDFDIALISENENIYIVGNSKLGVLEKEADECGFVKKESVLRQDVLQVINGDVTIDNLTLEDIVTSDIAATEDDSCGLQTETLAYSASATVTQTLTGGEMFTTRANRNGRIITTPEGEFVDAGEDRNAKLTVYHGPTDGYMSVYATGVETAIVTIRDGLNEIENFESGFVFQ